MKEQITGTADALQSRMHERIDRHVPEPVQRFVRWLRSDDFFSTSSSLAYYALMSIPPMVLVALWVAGGFLSDEALERLGSEVDEQSPGDLPVGEVLAALIEVATTVGVLSVLGALWPATAYGAALGRAFRAVTPRAQRRVRGMRGRLFALAIIALLPLAVFAGVAVLYLGPQLLPGTGWWLTAAFALAAYAIVVVVVAVIFLLYRMRDTKPHDVVFGAFLAATLMAVATGGYLVHLRFFADFESNYGASGLATLVLLALWLMIVNACLIIGYRVMLRRALLRAGRRGDREAAQEAERATEPDSGRQPTGR